MLTKILLTAALLIIMTAAAVGVMQEQNCRRRRAVPCQLLIEQTHPGPSLEPSGGLVKTRPCSSNNKPSHIHTIDLGFPPP